MGRSPSRQQFWCILDKKRSVWCDSNLTLWRSQEIEIGGNFKFPLIPILSILQQFVKRGELIYFGLGGAPATNDFGASLGEKERFWFH